MIKEKLILGSNEVYSTDSQETGLNNNVIICGSSGCGKTKSFVEARLLESIHSSIIVPVSKRRIVHQYSSFLENRGYDVGELNFVNPDLSTIGYDPLMYLHNHLDISLLSKAVIDSSLGTQAKTAADPYWTKAAESLLSAEIAFTLMTASKEEKNFTDVLDLHDNLEILDVTSKGVVTSLDAQFEILQNFRPKCFAISCWKSFKRLPEKTAGCVYGTLNTALDTLFTPELRRIMALPRKIDITSFGKERKALFISTSPANPEIYGFVNIFYSQMFKELFEYAETLPDGRLKVPVDVICDDFASAGGRIVNFPEYISIFREKGISVKILVQSESQLKSMYGENDATTIINNCDTYVYMGGMDLSTGQSMSQRLNIPLDEVLYMPLGQEYIIRRGSLPIKTERYNIFEDVRYKRVMDMQGSNRGAGYDDENVF